MGMDIKEIMSIIPHRQPFLLIDRVEEIVEGEKVIATKNVSYNEPFFAGHFPQEPVMPGVLIVEAMAQAGAVAILSMDEFKGKTAYFGGIKNAKFKKKVVPGDVLRLEVSIEKLKRNAGIGVGTAYVGDKVAAQAVIIFMIGINYYKNYVDEQHYLGIENNLKEIIKVNQKKTEEENPLDVIEPGDEDLTTTTTTTTTVYDIQYEKVFSTLQEINKDTIGWLTVNNTRIDYPVVQAKDNDYYLRRDYYQNKNRHGWIFMDYRNNPDELNENTIIYGHNLANQTMFGTLRYALNSYWYKKSANQIITFNTPNENMKFQIFSIYTIPTTNDYLDITFPTTDAYQAYIDLVKGRSIYDFNIEVTTDDKILTLSTCANGNDKRLVIHAKLIKES